ncbi:flagellar biosynthesis protein FliQ [Oceanirhabdus sp. W0125-5]|uniref:flagellar biosynthesis protein FliQ n=1 Tax=Oceanirhabdus sp. W0125-5 TaxID=2999116 RepID=UPI0022F31894|nr:flagellar biosynthesis protein FliQ [Oceanirhabdus sp. W0125-5]WBW95416.1 flagellar biosynthesis protein FliQ [Oceanirhabdus sp. W0125-5]
MTDTMVLSILKDALSTALLIASPILITATVVGLVIAILQATTQIQEQTLTFVPKLLITSLVGLIAGAWIIRTILAFTSKIFEIIANIT